MGILERENLTWRSVDRIILLACLTLTVWYAALGYLEKPGQRIRGSDSIGYYVYLPSIFLDGDLDLADDFRKLGGDEMFLFPAPNGRAGNPYSVGPSILWTPWFTLGHLVALVTSYPADGFSAPYYFLVYLGNSLYVLIGLLLTARLLKSFDLPPPVTLLTILSVLFLTQLTYYILPKSATSHGVSFASFVAFVLAIRKEGLTWKSGILGGLTVLVRWQSILLIPLFAVVDHLHRRGSQITLVHIKSYIPFILAIGFGILPQLVVWQVIYDRPFLVPQLEGYVDLSRLPALRVLFSLRHGLITWHPWWLAAIAGTYLLASTNKAWAFAIGGCLLVQLYINGVVLDWWGTWSFGHRRFVNLLPLLAIGFGHAYALASKDFKKQALLVIVVLGLWNQAFVYQYQRGLIPRSNPPSTTEFFDDKFSLRKVWRTQLAVNTAIQSFKKEDFKNFLRYSDEAHQSYPTYRNTLKVHSVASAVEGRLGEALYDFKRWLVIEPGNRTAQWGTADVQLKLGQSDQARTIIGDLGIKDAEVLKALDAGKGTLLTRSFFNAYRKDLDRIYTE
ncbi:MAG: tetratricopeptide repeat protein [Candidatus Latescibacterota bacterium]|nr:tetratricopeptide repeat protein [Candidatus Latescibacterota bacterium]